MNLYLDEVENHLKKLPSKFAPFDVYKTKLKLLGVPTPLQRELLKTGFSFSHLPHSQQRKIWEWIWNQGQTLESKQLALFYFQNRKKDPHLIHDWTLLKKFPKSLDNWAHSDVLSDIYSCLLEAHPQKVIPTLKKWNRSKNLWERRQTLISLFYYFRQRKSYPAAALVFNLLENRLEDQEYYVQKAVGWTLREASLAYPQESQLFIKKNVFLLSSIAFTTAMEKWPSSFKEGLKKKRAKFRKTKATSSN